MAEFLDLNISAVSGPVVPLGVFAARWQARHGITTQDRKEMTFYTAARLNPFSMPDGTFTIATGADFAPPLPHVVDGADAMGLEPSFRTQEVISSQLETAIADRR